MHDTAAPSRASGIRIAHASKTPWTAPPAVRGGTIVFKTLLEGVEGTPDNYQLLLADTAVDFKSPRHRHNFDQVRFGLTGRTNIGPHQNLEECDLAYFPEGTYYGPQDQQLVGATSLSMVIQFGGPSGNGYMSLSQLRTGFAQLAQEGSFEAGVYRRNTPAPDGRKNQDSYEAIWEGQHGRPLAYERPRYMDPVHMREPHFDWLPAPGALGVSTKHLGTFTECGIRIDFLRLESLAQHTLAPCGQTQILFVRHGSGRFNDEDTWETHTAVHVHAGQHLAMIAESPTEALLLRLPAF